MDPTSSLARVAALIGEPARSAMLLALLDGRALTVLELARCAGIAPPTASRHLAQLVGAGLLALQVQGRHRYHRLASAEVARAVEALLQLAAPAAPAPRRGPADDTLRLAHGWLRRTAESRRLQVTPRGAVALRDWLGLQAWERVVAPVKV